MWGIWVSCGSWAASRESRYCFANKHFHATHSLLDRRATRFCPGTIFICTACHSGGPKRAQNVLNRSFKVRIWSSVIAKDERHHCKVVFCIGLSVVEVCGDEICVGSWRRQSRLQGQNNEYSQHVSTRDHHPGIKDVFVKLVLPCTV